MDFEKAVKVATKNAKKLLPSANEFTLEGVIISNDSYEVTLSYFLTGKDPLALTDSQSNMFKLAKIMGTKKEYKVFIVDANSFSFKGFKAYKEG